MKFVTGLSDEALEKTLPKFEPTLGYKPNINSVVEIYRLYQQYLKVIRKYAGGMMFQKILKWFTFSKPKNEFGNPIYKDATIIDEFKSEGFNDVYQGRYYLVSSYYNKDSKEIRYIREQIEKIYSFLELNNDYKYELYFTNDIQKNEYSRYLSELDIERKYYNENHVYIVIGFKGKQIEEKDSSFWRYWSTWHSIDDYLNEGFRARYILDKWVSGNRDLDKAGRKKEFKIEINLDDYDKSLYFDRSMEKCYLSELRDLIYADIVSYKDMEYPKVEVKFISNSQINVEIKCGYWLIRDKKDEVVKRIENIVDRNIKRLYTDKYFYRNLIDSK